MQNWRLLNKKADFHSIAEKFHVHEVIARLLVNRNITEDAAIEAYLSPSKNQLHDPFLMKDMEKACALLVKRIAEGKKIRVIGDYDVDGIVSTFLLWDGLRKCGANLDYQIPDRIKDGYGINRNMIEEAKQDEVHIILTCDNGIAAWKEIAYAKECGIEVIITDHHDIPEQIPQAEAVVDPKQKDCEYPYKNLCGAVVALKLVEGVYRLLNKESPLEEYLEYAALATICDVVELNGENRIIVKLGLNKFKFSNNAGLLGLISEYEISKDQINTYHLGYLIGPCLNASGRLDCAEKGLELLCCTDSENAKLQAAELVQLNKRRKIMTEQGVKDAGQIVEKTELKQDYILVVYLPECHESIAGIIAGRLRERYYKPTLILTQGESCVKGSARSIEGYNMFEGLCECSQYLLKFGGHPLAAGLSMEEEQIEQFRKAINAQCRMTKEDLQEKVLLDAVLPLGYLTEDLIAQLELLEPFGKGNQKPLFAERDLQVLQAFYIGKTTKYFKFRLKNKYGKEIDALYFGNAEELEQDLLLAFGESEVQSMFRGRENHIIFSVAYYPGINEYMGKKTVQIVIQKYLI